MQFTFSGLDEYNLIRNEINNYVDSNLSKNDAFFICVAINEAVNNAIFHAKSSNIYLTLSYENNKFIIKVKHNGKGFNGNKLIEEMKNSNKDLFEETLYSEGNRGLLLIQNICEEVKYNDTGQELLLVKTIS